VLALDDTQLGFPEVTLPVVPGMEGCHWPFRRTGSDNWPKLLGLLLGGRSIAADAAKGWLVDFAGPVDKGLETAWKLATEGDHGLTRRPLQAGALTDVPRTVAGLKPGDETARKAIMDCVQAACGAGLAEAQDIQTRHSAEFMTTKACHRGRVGAEYTRTMKV
jgi:enoyl-CoA hydratase/carnithine racemase